MMAYFYHDISIALVMSPISRFLKKKIYYTVYNINVHNIMNMHVFNLTSCFPFFQHMCRSLHIH